jgi:predicted naringenin-chalcone synthase
MRDEVLHGLRQFDETGILTERLTAIIKQLPLSTLFSMKPSTAIIKRDNIICSACLSVVDVLTDYMKTHSKEDLLSLISTLCTDLVKYSEEVCSGVISLNLVSDFHS